MPKHLHHGEHTRPDLLSKSYDLPALADGARVSRTVRIHRLKGFSAFSVYSLVKPRKVN